MAASHNLEFHPYGWADMVFVFHFGFGKGGVVFLGMRDDKGIHLQSVTLTRLQP